MKSLNASKDMLLRRYGYSEDLIWNAKMLISPKQIKSYPQFVRSNKDAHLVYKIKGWVARMSCPKLPLEFGQIPL